MSEMEYACQCPLVCGVQHLGAPTQVAMSQRAAEPLALMAHSLRIMRTLLLQVIVSDEPLGIRRDPCILFEMT